jgi:hypothetical protein
MDRKEAIQHIKSLCPPFDSNRVGDQMLLDVIYDYGWDNLPTEILTKLAEEQIAHESASFRPRM